MFISAYILYNVLLKKSNNIYKRHMNSYYTRQWSSAVYVALHIHGCFIFFSIAT